MNFRVINVPTEKEFALMLRLMSAIMIDMNFVPHIIGAIILISGIVMDAPSWYWLVVIILDIVFLIAFLGVYCGDLFFRRQRKILQQ